MKLDPLFVFVSSSYLLYHAHLPCRTVADISIADYGRKEIDIVEIEMPGGTRISGSLRVTIQK